MTCWMLALVGEGWPAAACIGKCEGPQENCDLDFRTSQECVWKRADFVRSRHGNERTNAREPGQDIARVAFSGNACGIAG